MFFSVLCLLCLYERLFICALWSPAGKGPTLWLSFMVSNCDFLISILGQVWYLILSIPDLWTLTYFKKPNTHKRNYFTVWVKQGNICLISPNDL